MKAIFKKLMLVSSVALVFMGCNDNMGDTDGRLASVNTFLKLQYEQVMTKEKYGGMKRSIFCKAI